MKLNQKNKLGNIGQNKSIWMVFAVSFFTLIFTFISIFPNLIFAAAGVPALINFQGRLLDSSGNLLGGTSGTEYCYKFSIYDAVSAGSKIWPAGSPSTMTITTREGVFNANVGDTGAGGDALDLAFTDDQAFINIEVATKVGATCAPGDGAESFETLAPRQRVASSAFAINSKTVGGFTPAQSATGSQIPALTSGSLVLGDTNPGLKVTGANTLTFQSGVTGDIQFYSSSNKITSTGALTLAGGFTSSTGTITLGGLGGGGSQCLQVDNSGVVTGTGSACGAGSVTWNSLANPTGTQTLAFDDGELNAWTVSSDTETFQTITANSLTTGKVLGISSSSLTSGSLIDLAITGTAGLTNQKALNISLSGANGTGAQTTYGAYLSNTHTGTSTNVGLYATATGGTNNYAGIFENGYVGIGITAPTSKLHIVGADSTETIQIIKQGLTSTTSFQTLIQFLDKNGTEHLAVRSRGSDGATVLESAGGWRTNSANDLLGYRWLTSGSAAQGMQSRVIQMGSSYKADITTIPSGTLIGSTSTTGDLFLQSTSGVGTTGADIHLLVGNNGATEAMTILNSGYVGVGDIDPASIFTVGNGDLFQVNSSGDIVTPAAEALSITTGTTGALTLDSGTTGTVNLATGNNAKTLNLGTGTAGNNINIGTNNTTLDNIAIGSGLDFLIISGASSSFFVLNGVNVSATEFNILDTGINWNELSNPTATQSLTFDDGELNDWTVSSDTETFQTITANSLTTGKVLGISSSSLSSGSLIDLAITGTAGLTNQKGLNISLSGANSNSSQTTYGTYLSNTHTGTGSINVGLYATTSGGANNYAAIFDAGNVGIGTTTPGYKLQVNGDGGFFGTTTQNYLFSNSTLSDTNGLLDVNAISSSTFVPAAVFSLEQTGTGSLTSYGTQNFWSSSAVVVGGGVGQTAYGIQNDVNKFGADTATGTYTIYASHNSASNTGRTDAGTVNTYGGYFSAVGDTAGTSTAIGAYFTATGADNNYAAIFENGNVGIGTTAPSTALHVQGVSRFQSISTNYLQIDNEPSTNNPRLDGQSGDWVISRAGSTRLKFYSGWTEHSGAQNFPGLTASELTATDASKNLVSLSAATYPSLTEISYVKGVTSAIQTQLNAKFTLPSLTAGSVLFSDGSTIAQDNANFFWDNSNDRLGIGTTTPENTLTVTKNSATAIPALGVNGGEFGFFRGSAGSPQYGMIAGVLGTGDVFQQVQRVDGTATSYNLLLQPSGGKVGIGLTNPTQSLTVSSPTAYEGVLVKGNVAPNVSFVQNSGTTPTYKVGISGNDGSAFSISSGTAATDRLFISSTGNVGIGDISPASLFTVGSGDLFQVNSTGVITATTTSDFGATLNSSNSTRSALTLNNTGGGDPFLYLSQSGTARWAVGYEENGSTYDFKIRTSAASMEEAYGTTRFLIQQTTGNVGIGDVSPASLFTVGSGDLFQVNSSGDIVTAAAENLSITTGTTGALTLDSGTTGIVNLGTGNNAKTLNLGTGTAGNTINIGTNNTTLDTISIGSALDNVAITGDSWSITDAGALTVASCSGCGGGASTWNAITDPTGTQTLAFDDAELTAWTVSSDTETFQTITANSLTTGKVLAIASSSVTTGSLIDLAITGTAGLTGQKGLNISLSGANGTGAQTTYGAYLSNTHTGTSTNVGLYATASGGSNNYAAIFQNGNVGIGTTAPVHPLHVGPGNDVSTAGPSETVAIFQNNGAANLAVRDATNNVEAYIYADVSGVFMGSATSHDLYIGTGTNIALSIDTSNKVNVGGDTAPNELFTVGSTSQFQVNTSGDILTPAAEALSITTGTTGALTLTSGTTGTVNLATGNNAKTLNISTGTAGNTINIATDNTTSDTIAIGSALDNIAITSDSWSVTDAGVLTVVSCTGCGGGAGTWNGITNPTGTQSLTFDDAELTAWTVSSDTETFQTITANSLTTGKVLAIASSSLTTGSLIDLAITGTAGLTNQKALNISLSGANGTGAQTTYGAYLSNTHTGTSVNVGLYTTASGGSTNLGLNVDSGQTLLGGTTLTSGTLAKLNIVSTNSSNGSTTAIAGIHGEYTFNNGGTASYVQVGNRFVFNNAPTTNSNTMVGEVIRTVDNTTLANLVRGIEVTSNAGSNTAGTNTGIRTTGATFGIQAITNGAAGSVAVPAAIFGESTGTTQGDILRLYSTSMTSAAQMAQFYHNSSTFTGTGLLMDFAEGSGTFSGNFLDFQKNNTSLFKVTNGGVTSLGFTTSQAYTSAVCSNLANATAPTADVQYTLYDCGSTPVADYAEMYPVESGVEFGDIVVTGTELVDTYDLTNGIIDWTKVKGQVTKLVKSNKAYQGNVIGIVSDNFGDFSSTGYNVKEGDNPMPIALVGRLPVKIASTSSDIKAGDYITTSGEVGRGMKAIKAGVVIGKALEDWTAGSGKDTVMVFVEQGYYNGVSSTSFAGIDMNTVAPDQVSKEILAKLILEENNIDPLNVSELLTDRVVAGLEVITPDLVAKNVDTDNLTVSENSEFAGLSNFIGEVSFMNKVSFENVVEFKAPPMFNKDTAGFAVVKAGSKKVDIVFENPYMIQPVVTASISFEDNIVTSPDTNEESLEILTDEEVSAFFNENINHIVTNKTKEGFSIRINKEATRDIKFSWVALAVKDVNIFESVIPGLSIDENTIPVNNSPTVVEDNNPPATESVDVNTETSVDENNINTEPLSEEPVVDEVTIEEILAPDPAPVVEPNIEPVI